MSDTGFISGNITDGKLAGSAPAMYAATKKKGGKKGSKKGGIRDSRITCPGVNKPAKKK